MQIVVKVEEQDMVRLERLHYLSESKANLLTRLTSNVVDYNEKAFKTLMEDYCDTFKEYSLCKEEIDAKYRPTAENGTAISWRADFVARTLVYEVE